MSRSSSKTAQSGLKTIHRDWSEHGSSQELDIDWPMTPPPLPSSMTAAQKRLKAIQEALLDNKESRNRPIQDNEQPKSHPLGPSKTFNKRLSDGAPSSEPEPVGKKHRQLPASWNPSTSTSSTTEASKPLSASKPSSASTTVQIQMSTAPSKAKMAKIFLSQEQKQILNLVESGLSVFYTGSAGTGKSVLMREIIRTMRKKHIKSSDAVAITASTGIAACNIGGVTIHSFAGIGIGIESAEDLAKKVKRNRKASARWLRTKVLIIDEVSMLDGDLFDKLEHIGRIMRKNQLPFGGIQIIVTGDFFQLPPVMKGSSSNVKFAFEAEQWGKVIQRTFNLTKVFRQTDEEFVRMLNEMRFGNLTQGSIAKFKALSRSIQYNDGLGPTELFPRREDVDQSNSRRLHHLTSKSVTYKAIDAGDMEQTQRDKILANFMAPLEITLKQDAQVMLIKNMDETLVNGSMGRVMRFTDSESYALETGSSTASSGPPNPKKAAAVGIPVLYPVVEFLLPHGGMKELLVTPESFKVELPTGEVQASRMQLPLILAWAMSIHKSQGQTLERVKVDLGKVFEKGQAYVALSRATSLDGLQVLNFRADKVMAHPKVVQWSKTLETIAEQ